MLFLFISLSWAHSITAITFITCFICLWLPPRFTFGCVFTWRWVLWRARNPQRHWCYHASSWTTLYWRKNQQSACSKEVITDNVTYKFHKKFNWRNMVTQGNRQVVQGQLFSLFTSSSFFKYFYLQIIERKKEHKCTSRDCREYQVRTNIPLWLLIGSDDLCLFRTLIGFPLVLKWWFIVSIKLYVCSWRESYTKHGVMFLVPEFNYKTILESVFLYSSLGPPLLSIGLAPVTYTFFL